MSIRWKDADVSLRKTMPRHLVEHCDPCCLAVKEDAIKARRCVKHCVLNEDDWLRSRPPSRCSTCHAGFKEFREPIFAGTQFMGTLMIGPFQSDKNQHGIAQASVHVQSIIGILKISIAGLHRERDLERHVFAQQSLHPSLTRLSHVLMEYYYGMPVDVIALSCQVSLSRLQHLCKEELGKSLGQLCEGALLRRVHESLHHTNKSIGEIAASLGFTDQRYFSTWFKRVDGMTPSAWREQQEII